LVIIASFDKTRDSMESYKQRWQIESTFKALKTSGFNLKETHLNDLVHLEKLLVIVIIAFLLCIPDGYISMKTKRK